MGMCRWQQLCWDGTQWVVNSANIYNDGGNVGINTNNPLSTLDINGSMAFRPYTGAAIPVTNGALLISAANIVTTSYILINSGVPNAGNAVFYLPAGAARPEIHHSKQQYHQPGRVIKRCNHCRGSALSFKGRQQLYIRLQ